MSYEFLVICILRAIVQENKCYRLRTEKVLGPFGDFIIFKEMKPTDRAQRVVALTAIKDKAEELAGGGMDALGVKTFVAGARRKLAEEKPDPETYYRAAMVAKARKDQAE